MYRIFNSIHKYPCAAAAACSCVRAVSVRTCSWKRSVSSLFSPFLFHLFLSHIYTHTCITPSLFRFFSSFSPYTVSILRPRSTPRSPVSSSRVRGISRGARGKREFAGAAREPAAELPQQEWSSVFSVPCDESTFQPRPATGERNKNTRRRAGARPDERNNSPVGNNYH